MTTRDIFPGGTLTRVGHLLRQRPYLFSNAALRRLIDDWLPIDRLEDLPTPVRVVTTPLAGDTAVYHRHGDLTQLLLASAAVPGVFSPIELPASCGFAGPHVDGGVSDLVPVRGAADFAPTRVFVLDASVPARLPRGRTPIDILVASMGVAMRVNPAPDLGSVEVHHLRTPDLGSKMTDFTNTAQHIADGRAAAEGIVGLLRDPEPSELPPPRAGRPAYPPVGPPRQGRLSRAQPVSLPAYPVGGGDACQRTEHRREADQLGRLRRRGRPARRPRRRARAPSRARRWTTSRRRSARSRREDRGERPDAAHRGQRPEAADREDRALARRCSGTSRATRGRAGSRRSHRSPS